MKIQNGALEFDWDEGNLDKSRRNHDITPEESESVFLDDNSLVLSDEPHSEIEARFVMVGKSDKDRNLFIIFTIRKGKIRVISARRMHKREVTKYGKA